MRFCVMVLVIVAAYGCGKAHQSSNSTVAGLDTEFGGFDRTVSSPVVLQPNSRLTSAAAGAKQPALVYYVVDTEEPFYQATVDYEIRSLRSVCDADHPNTNWVAFVNSWIVYNNSFYLACVGGKLTEAHLSSALSGLIEQLSAASYDNTHPTVGLRIPLQHKPEFNAMFATYPLSHPEVLWYLLDFATTSVFPTSDYSLTVSLKSHGSNQLMLAGLTADQRQEKSDRQKGVLAQYLSAMRTAALNSNADIDVRNRVACEATGGLWESTACFCPSSQVYINQFFGVCERKLGLTGLGTVNLNEIGFDQIGLGSVGTNAAALAGALGANGLGANGLGANGLGANGLGANGLGANGLGANGLGANGLGANGLGANGLGANGLGANGLGANGLGANGLGANGLGANGLGAYGLGVNGLGFDDVGSAGFGLNTSSHFGTPDDAMLTVLGAVKDKGVVVDFLLFEACSTDLATKPAEQARLAQFGNIAAYYSASGSMWYRNVDWQTVLQVASDFAGAQQETKIRALMAAVTATIPNFVPKAPVTP